MLCIIILQIIKDVFGDDSEEEWKRSGPVRSFDVSATIATFLALFFLNSAYMLCKFKVGYLVVN